jgi:hypothetical protein
MTSWRWVRILAFLAGGAFLAWIMVPDPWLLTLALTLGGVAADRGVVLLPVSDWWRAVFGVPVTAGVIMLWVSEGRALVLLLWGLALLLLHLAVKGMVHGRQH